MIVVALIGVALMVVVDVIKPHHIATCVVFGRSLVEKKGHVRAAVHMTKGFYRELLSVPMLVQSKDKWVDEYLTEKGVRELEGRRPRALTSIECPIVVEYEESRPMTKEEKGFWMAIDELA